MAALACALGKAVPKKRRTKAQDFLQLTLKKECVRRCPDFAVFCVLSLWQPGTPATSVTSHRCTSFFQICRKTDYFKKSLRGWESQWQVKLWRHHCSSNMGMLIHVADDVQFAALVSDCRDTCSRRVTHSVYYDVHVRCSVCLVKDHQKGIAFIQLVVPWNPGFMGKVKK